MHVQLHCTHVIQYMCHSLVLQMLGKLLKSKNPEDLRAANRLIRDMVRRVSHEKF